MASLIYNSAIDDTVRGLIDFDTNIFKAMLVTSSYVADKDTHDKRDDITNEVSGTGYIAGGSTCGVTVTKNIASNSVTIQFAEVEWTSSTITARGCVYYKSSSGAASLDQLVAYNDFGSNISTSAATPRLSVAPTTITLETNPGEVVLPPRPPISVPAAAYLFVNLNAVVQASAGGGGGTAVEGPLIIPIISSGPELAQSLNPANAYYDSELIVATYSSAEMAVACGGATSATISGMRITVLEAPAAINQPFPGYVIGAKNTTNSILANNSGANGGTFTQVYGPGSETFIHGAVKEFLFSSPIVWTGGNFAFVWAWNIIPGGYTESGYVPLGDGTIWVNFDYPDFTVASEAPYDTGIGRPAFKLLYTS